MKKYKRECVACGSEVRLGMDLWKTPFANNLLDGPSEEFDVFPLGIDYCIKCGHAQLTYFATPEELFSKYYYQSGTSNTMCRFFDIFAGQIAAINSPGASVLDIASNDGSFLASLSSSDLTPLGIDPASNLVEQANQNGLESICGFFPSNELDGRSFDCITALNVFAHNPNPYEFMRHIPERLNDNGTFFIQVSQANMLATGEFDTIYHEHYSFFTINSMRELCDRAGLYLVNWQLVNIHGDSIIFHIKKNNSTSKELDLKEFNLDQGKYLVHYEQESEAIERLYSNFLNSAQKTMKKTSDIVNQYRDKGYKIALAGVAAKSLTFMWSSKLDYDYFFDQTPTKIDKWVPGTGVKIQDFDKIENIEKVLVVIGAWNFSEEIIEKIQAIRGKKETVYLKYYPEIELIK